MASGAVRPAPQRVDPRRCRSMNGVELAGDSGNGGAVLYWMSRDQRVQDNWALLRAQEIALEKRAGLFVCFCLVPKFLDATLRHFDFMLRGIEETQKELAKLQIPFELCRGQAKDQVPKLVRRLGRVHAVVCDFSPLRVPLQWVQAVGKALGKRGVPLEQVDAHNVVPVWCASEKKEVGARTLRPKIRRLLPEFLTEFPKLRRQARRGGGASKASGKPFNLQKALASLKVDRKVLPCAHFTPGSLAGRRKLTEFIKVRLASFAALRNDPTEEALSGLSPWLHFGQIAAQRCAIEVGRYNTKKKGGSLQVRAGCESFLEESIVRRELSDNYCFYNHRYDSLDSAAPWAIETLNKHKKDKREAVYSRAELEPAKTHDDLWNAAQRQMVRDGKMHGFLRMYWAKKILEWKACPREALKDAIYLNDKYNIDGRDPNGYVGCMWSICGVHDMGWPERKIFGKIRYMNYAGCKRKFRIETFISRYPELHGGASAPAKRATRARTS